MAGARLHGAVAVAVEPPTSTPIPIPAPTSADAAAAATAHTSRRRAGRPGARAEALGPAPALPARRPPPVAQGGGGEAGQRGMRSGGGVVGDQRDRAGRLAADVALVFVLVVVGVAVGCPVGRQPRSALVLGDQRHRRVGQVRVAGPGRQGERAELFQDLRVGRAVARHPPQARGGQAGQLGWHPGQVGRLGREPDQDVHHGVAPVGRMTGRGEHQRRPEREHVARGRGQGGVPGLLGGHVGGGAGRAAGGGELNPLGHPGHPEVDHLRAVRRHQHVRRLDVAVHQPDAVNRLQRLRAAGREPAHRGHRQRPAPAHQHGQRRRGHVRGGDPGQVRLRVGLDDRRGEHAADPAGGRHLAGEPGPVALLLGQLDPDRLHRDQPPGGGAGQEHLPHRPRAELADDRVRADPFRVPAAQRLHDRLCQRRLPSLQALVRHTILHNQLHDGQ